MDHSFPPLSEFTKQDVPLLLLPYQQAWNKDEAPFKNYTKSRRIGISWGDAANAALLGALDNGRNTFYMGYEKEMARGYINDCGEWAKLYNLTASAIEETEEVFRDGDEDKSILVFRIYFNSGKFVEALSSNPRNMRSRQGDLVIDEAAFHDDLPGLLKAAKAMRVWGGRVRCITTLNGVDEPYYELDQQVLAGKLPYSRHFTTFLDAVEQGLYKRICLMTGRIWSEAAERDWIQQVFEEFGDDADEELMCIPSQGTGRYLSRALLEQNMNADVPVLRWTQKAEFATQPQEIREAICNAWLNENVEPLLRQLNPNLPSSLGQDFGRSGDLSVILPIQTYPNLVRRAPFGLELRNIPYEQQRQVLFFICDRLPRFRHAALDGRGNGGYLAEVAMQRYGGLRISTVMATRQWYADNWPRYKAGLEDRQCVWPLSLDWIDDHRMVEYVRGVPQIPDSKKNKGTDGRPRHGDSAIAALLGWFASCQEGGEIDYESIEIPEMAGFDGFTVGSGGDYYG